jgi:cobalt-zinc-cadmium efflux system outer membrane protein
MRCPPLLLLAVWFAYPLMGCASYEAAPISPAENAQSLDNRTLDNPQLQKFIRAEIGRDGKADPPPVWDLSTLTLAAIYYHPDIAVAHAKLTSAEAAVITARQRPNPSLSIAGLLNQAAVPGAVVPGAAAITVGPTIDFLIETFGKREDRTARAVHLADAARWDLAVAGWQVRSRARTALLDLWAAQRRLALNRQQLKLQDELVGLLEQRFAVGEASSTDVMLARVARQQVIFAVRNLEQMQAVARAQLATALGVPARALERVDISMGAFEHPPPISAHSNTRKLRRDALTKRADVEAGLEEYEAAQSALQLQIANQYPNLMLGPGYNYDYGLNKFILGPGADQIPILNQNQGPIAEALAARQQAAANFTALQAQITGAIDEAAAAYRTATQSIATGDKLLADDQRHEDQIASQFHAGQADREALVTAEVEVAATGLSRFDAVVRQGQAIGALEDALQQPLFNPGRWPTVPPDQSAVRSRTTSPS